MKPSRPIPLSLAVQEIFLRRHFPEGSGRIARSQLIWEQAIQPHPLAHVYECRLEYKRGFYPRVFCVKPDLFELADGRTLPHIYKHESLPGKISLCMFMHERRCWNDGMALASVVVPLAFYWLANVEHWLFTGDWHGGGTHPTPPSPPKRPPVFPSDLPHLSTSLPRPAAA